ncbi:MAG: helix-turn-helix domain-containing protein [Ruminococcaceae bacterium]|nr:helix-turn-helix domain-containing protein [Oscillospiraceae bacterium]
MELTTSFTDRLRAAMDARGMRAVDLAHTTGLSKARISQYTNGIYVPKADAMHKLARALDVSDLWLEGYDVPMERGTGALPDYPDIFPIERRRIPVLGEIACGKPILTDEEHDSFVMSGTNLDADFCLRAKGDSMIGARIQDGDIVFIKKSDMVANGEIAAVVIEDEATLKRVYYYPEKSKLILTPENPKYEPLVFMGPELDEIHILGKAVAFQSEIK